MHKKSDFSKRLNETTVASIMARKRRSSKQVRAYFGRPNADGTITMAQDAEKYRLDVRPDLIEWFATLRDADTNDWLVIFDACKVRDSRGRVQVLEKVRSDLSKYINRIVEIDSNVTKIPALLRTLADQCLLSFDYWAHLFEATLKTERDACFSLDWSFVNYMITQIQYSRLLLCANLFDHSLAQLDELDAMVSLLIAHFAAAPAKARWIEALCSVETEHAALVSLVQLYSSLDEAARQLLSQHITSVDEDGPSPASTISRCTTWTTDLRRLRAIIFCCQLSVILNRYASQSVSAEVACQRVIWYGAVLVQAIRREEAVLTGVGEEQSASRRLSNALWCLEVLHFAGRLCDLAVVSSESEAACALWMTLCRMIQNLDPSCSNGTNVFLKDRSDIPSESDSPLVLLEKCVVDTAAYDEHFVKLYESALAMLKHCGWRRHARTLGAALADFYRRRGKYADALHLYLKLARQLEDERWCQGYLGLLLAIGDDLLDHCTLRERLKFFGDLSCAREYLPLANLSGSYCSKFKNEFKRDWNAERLPNSHVCPWFHVRYIRPSQKSILCGCDLRWTAIIESRFPETMSLSSISLCYSVSSKLQGPAGGGEQNAFKKKLADFRRESCSVVSDVVDCAEFYTMDAWDQSGCLDELRPGNNTLQFGGQCSQPGLCVPGHLHVRLEDGRLDVQVRLGMDSSSHCTVKTVDPEVILITPATEYLWAGVTQTVKFRLTTGALSRKLEPEEEKDLRLETPHPDLQLKNVDSDDDADTGVSLVEVPADLAPGGSTEVEQAVFCNIHGSDENRTCEVSTLWRGCVFKHQLLFKPVFHWMSDLKVIGERLLLSITLYNDSERPLVVRDPRLTFAKLGDDGEIDAELLNDKGDQVLSFGAPYTLAWYVPSTCSSLGVIVFNYQFKDTTSDAYTCYADVALQKPAIVEACCQMASEKIVCRVGMACDFVVSLKALDPSLRSVDIVVTLLFDNKFWACVGEMSESIRLKENGLGQAFFQVTPQCAGFLPMPAVKAQLTGDLALNKACQAYVRSKGKQVHVLAPLTTYRRSFAENKLDLQL